MIWEREKSEQDQETKLCCFFVGEKPSKKQNNCFEGDPENLLFWWKRQSHTDKRQNKNKIR